MSDKKTWLGQIIADLLETFKTKWPDFFVKIFNKIPDELKEKIAIGIVIVENIKKFIDSPLADIVTSIIPGSVDDKIKERLRIILPVILERYNVANQSKLTPEASHLIATNINQDLTGLSFGQTALTTEIVYQNS